MRTFRRTRRIATTISLVAWGLVVWWACINALPHNPQSPGLFAERGTRIVLPEGWGFFTRDPREPDLMLAQHGLDDAWELEPPHASARNLFGLCRRSRALPVEASRLLQASKARFEPCEDAWAACLDAAVAVDIINDVEHPVLCGDVGFVRRAPVPWAWARLMEPSAMPTQIFRANIRCPHALDERN